MSAIADRSADVARVLAIALLIALPFVGGYMFDQHLLGTALGALLAGLAACLACALGSTQVRLGLGRAAWPVAGFLAWYTIATIASAYLHASLVSLLHVGSYVAFAALCARLFADERWRRWAWIAIAAAGAAEGIIGLRDWTQTVIFQGDPSWRIFGTMYNPNVLAGYFVVVLAAAAVALAVAWRYTQEQPDRPRLALIAAGFALPIAGAALLLTGSRAGMLGAMFGAAVFVIAAPTRIRVRWFVAAGLALVLLVVVAPPLRNRIVSAAAQSNSAIFRWYTWVGTANMVEARPLLGFGPGTFQYAYARHAVVGFTRMAHQTPLQLAAEAGIPALLLALASVAVIARRLVLGLRTGGLRAVECAAGLAALAAVGLHSQADYTWYVPAVGLTLAAIVGLAMAASRDDAPRVAVRWRCWIGAALALVAAGACAWGLQAQLLHAEGKGMLARGRYQTAIVPLRRAAELDPLDASIAADLAQATAVASIDGSARAVELRLRAAQLNPLASDNFVGLAEVYARLDEEQSALAAAQRAVEVAPNYARAYVTLAELQQRFSREDEALETWRALDEVYESPVGQVQAIDQPTDFLWAYAWLALGEAAEEQGRADEAAKYYGQTAELTGSYASAQRANEEALRMLGTWNEPQVAEAERMQARAEAGARRVEERDDR